MKPIIYKICCCELKSISLCAFDDQESNLDRVEESLNTIVVGLPKTSTHGVLKHLIIPFSHQENFVFVLYSV